MKPNEIERNRNAMNLDPEFGLTGADCSGFDERLEQLRVELGMSHGDFTGLLSIPDRAPGRYGNYDCDTLTIPHVLFLIQTMRVRAAWLMAGEGEMFQDGSPHGHAMYEWCAGEVTEPEHREILHRRWIGGEIRRTVAASMNVTASRIKQIEDRYRNLYESRTFWDNPGQPIPSIYEHRLPGISARLQTTLYNGGLSLSDCRFKTDAELRKEPNMGATTLKELRDLIASLDFSDGGDGGAEKENT